MVFVTNSSLLFRLAVAILWFQTFSNYAIAFLVLKIATAGIYDQVKGSQNFSDSPFHTVTLAFSLKLLNGKNIRYLACSMPIAYYVKCEKKMFFLQLFSGNDFLSLEHDWNGNFLEVLQRE